MVRIIEHAVRQRMCFPKSSPIVHDGGMGNEVVVFGFDNQHITLESPAGSQGAILVRTDCGQPILGQALAIELTLGQVSLVVLV